MLRESLADVLLANERMWVERILANPGNISERVVYADWLDEQGEPARASFLRQMAVAMESMANWPDPTHVPAAWRELLGFDLLQVAAKSKDPLAARDVVLGLQRPALRFSKTEPGGDVPIGASKVGGKPDLPSQDAWPIGEDCKACYNDATEGYKELAGFMGQVNLAELADTFAGKDLPKAGVLSFFCFQDWANDNPDAVGVGAFYFPDVKALTRTEPSVPLTEGNAEAVEQLLVFDEILDLPESYDGPWSEDYGDVELDTTIRSENFDNMLGYGRATTGGDPTPNKNSRHLIVLENPYECRMHIQIPQDELARANFDAITLDWVDFD